MQRPFFYLFILSCLCPYLNLHNFVTAEVNDTPLCDSASKSLLTCANLKNISYPFGDVEPCAASDSFRINCSNSSQAYWNAFTSALGSDDQGALELAPALMGIYQGPYLNFINLTWNLESYRNGNACEPLLANTVDTYIPKSIDLTSFANGSFLLSSFNHILLLNCSNLPSSLLQLDNTLICHAYQQQCDGVLQNTPCMQIEVPAQELMLHQALSNFSCTHFQFLVATEDSTSIASWTQGLIQIFYGNVQCEACDASGGTCVYDKTAHTYQECACGNSTFADTDCNHLRGCKGFRCNTSAIIGIGVASAVVLTVIVTLLVLWVFYRKRQYSTKRFTSASSNRLFTQRAYMLSKKFGPVETKEFSFEVLSKATKSFADENMVGDGGFGAVYFGILRDGREVAVKRLYHDNFKRMDHFYNEIQILSKLNHPNLVKLYGFCCQDSNDLLLVFEYASNGTVSDQLHDATKPAMPWKTRLNIARETAEALSYLHNSVNPPIYHRDVKTTNILLDDGLHAKLADFGLSRLVPLQATHVSTAPQGTPGYLDPDYHQCYQLTDKSDVYSFGVVLAELVSAKLAVDMSRDRREINLSNLALMKIGCGQWEDLVDPRLEMRKNPDVELMVKRVVELAFTCLHAEKDSRPTMKYIAETLASLCKEFDYRHDDDVNGTFSFKVAINAPSSADETSQLIKSKSTPKSTLYSADSPPSSTDWTSSNASSYVNSF